MGSSGGKARAKSSKYILTGPASREIDQECVTEGRSGTSTPKHADTPQQKHQRHTKSSPASPSSLPRPAATNRLMLPRARAPDKTFGLKFKGFLPRRSTTPQTWVSPASSPSPRLRKISGKITKSVRTARFYITLRYTLIRTLNDPRPPPIPALRSARNTAVPGSHEKPGGGHTRFSNIPRRSCTSPRVVSFVSFHISRGVQHLSAQIPLALLH